MKIIILAAGLGKRLGKELPKPLVRLCDGKSILEHQVENITEITSPENIILITGYKSEMIQERFPQLKQIRNPRYDQTNTSKSLLQGLTDINEDLLFMNGDIVFDPDILRLILVDKSSNKICVNNFDVGEEEIKYNLDSENKIKELSKSVADPLGEAVGINFIRSEDIDNIRESLEECDDEDYFEKGIEYSIEKGLIFCPLDIENKFCVEIDFEEDLQNANKYLENLKN